MFKKILQTPFALIFLGEMVRFGLTNTAHVPRLSFLKEVFELPELNDEQAEQADAVFTSIRLGEKYKEIQGLEKKIDNMHKVFQYLFLDVERFQEDTEQFFAEYGLKIQNNNNASGDVIP